MNKLWDKFLLGLSCCAFMLAEGTDPSNITTLLLAVICSAILQIKPSSAVAYLSVIAYSSLCIFSKEALILAPLVLYDAFCTKFYPAMVLTFIGVLANIFTLGKDIFPLVALFLVSFTISTHSVLNEKLTKMLINTRDNSKELTTQLVEKNKAMQRNQDYEIYLATLKERNRIAREIHDNVGHMLTRSILQLGALSVINKDETVGEAINDLSGTLNTAMTSIRSSVHDLHDDSIALKPAVEDCIRPLKDRFAVSCDYDFSERMSRDVKFCFIGVIKEALSNTAKHSDGDSIKIIIREHPALYQLSIADNGSCPEKIDENGMGLANMRERAALAAGLALTMTVTAFADEPYTAYNYDYWDDAIPSQSAYRVEKTVTGADMGLDMNIVIIDDDKLVAMSLKTILESTGSVNVLAIGSCGEEAIELYTLLKPDVLLMDIRMNGMSGIEAGEKILAGYPDARILYLTTFSDDEYIIKAVLMGAKGDILKQDFESICPALETVMNRQTVFGSDVASKLPELLTNHSSFDFDHYGIVEKEQEIIEQVAKGLSNKEIASLLYLSEGTVRNYISTILEKLSLRDRTQLAIFYYTNIQ